MTVVSRPSARSTAAEFPIHLGSPEAFAGVRALLVAASFDEPTVAARLGGKTLVGVPRLFDGRKTLGGAVEDANAALVRLFVDGEVLPADLLRRLFGGEGLAGLTELGLLAPAHDAEAHDAEAHDAEASLAPTVMLAPTRGLWLASDLRPVTASTENARQDYVFSAINELSAQFMSVVPHAPGAKVLELCAGTGVAALSAAKHGAGSVVAADLVPRCVHFARFNALLNGLADRVRVVESDAWDALEGETFDLVVAHPPYVPALSHEFDFRDAGEDGEQVTRRIIEGLKAHVAPGGRVVIRAALSDRRGATIAERVRQWLGDASDEFDLVQLETTTYGPMEAYRSVTKDRPGFVDCERWLRHFEGLGIERFAICLFELRRDAHGRQPVTERRVLGSAIDDRAMDWHFRWARFVAGAGATPEERLAGMRPRVAPGARLAVHLESDADGRWHTVAARVETGWPSHGMVKAPALAPTLLELCDGTRDVPALLDGLREAGLVSGDVGLGEVAHLIEVFAASGAIELPACSLPAYPVARS